LFEHLLTFLDTDEELNPVLAGYFCKLFQVLVGNKPKEVFGYVYAHPEVMERMVRHIYQKSISEVLIRLLNVSENILEGEAEISPADMDSLR
jgi:serine/threonine-protein phosphatase 6 regulatory subunit 3